MPEPKEDVETLCEFNELSLDENSTHTSTKQTLKEFKPPNRQPIAFSWDLSSLDFPLERDGCININSSKFDYLGYKFNRMLSYA